MEPVCKPEKGAGRPASNQWGLAPRRREGAVDVTLGQLQVVGANRLRATQFLSVTSRTTRPGTPMTRERGGMRRFSVTRPRRDDALGADLAAGQQQRPDADQAVAADEPAVQHRPMTDHHSLLDVHRLFAIGVQNAAVLDIDAQSRVIRAGSPRTTQPNQILTPADSTTSPVTTTPGAT